MLVNLVVETCNKGAIKMRITFDLDDETVEKLKLEARKHCHTNKSAIIRQAISFYLNRNTSNYNKPQESARQSTSTNLPPEQE